jgi:hypothetical protein
MNFRQIIAILLSLPMGFLIMALFVWLFAIDIATQEKFLNFPDDWHIIDLITNGFAILMFGGATRAAYKVIMEIWCADGAPKGNAPNNTDSDLNKPPETQHD